MPQLTYELNVGITGRRLSTLLTVSCLFLADDYNLAITCLQLALFGY